MFKNNNFEIKMDNFEMNHEKTFVHIDMDCFYAQVEMIKNPDLVNKPLGVQQKNIVVTCNYPAREFGVKKCMLVSEAQKVCPNLVLVNGEDLHDYRQISYTITTFLQKFTPLVERLGLDENYLDVSELVNNRLSLNLKKLEISGKIFGSVGENVNNCECGCYERLTMGTMIAEEIRESIKKEFKLTSCAGIAHNKLLAKIVGSVNKPNSQTVVFPNNAQELMISLGSVGSIPGIGKVMEELLLKESIKTVQDLQNGDICKLKKLFGEEKAKLIRNLSFGFDRSIVKPSFKPQSIGIEDSCKPITAIFEIKSKLNQLLSRLMVLISEDGRIPRTIKVTIRIFDGIKNISHKKTKQCNITTSLFSFKDNKIGLNSTSNEKLMSIVMNLVNKMMDVNRSYNITLLGLSFTKFIERTVGKSSINSFLRKNQVEVQSITNIQHKTDFSPELMEISPIDLMNGANAAESESDYEPSPKKTRQFPVSIISKKRFFESDPEDCPSPSKLKVADLHLSNDYQRPTTSDGQNDDVPCPPNANADVFRQLPKEIREELWSDYNRGRAKDSGTKPKVNTLLNYFVKNC